MELRPSRSRTYPDLRPTNFCAQCGETIFMPEWSEYHMTNRVRHVWACDACGYTYETVVSFPEL
ncbi:MAG: hypothetical protein QOC56_1537 [Alphaproteobacteria bacterium]|jgi:ribosomal protein S27AE|nr:hypothetical protein [Alphaproteobacteria bacterium]MEA2938033.1 hypothetical protein [Alphaproteobacteria bacterium]